MKNHIQSLKKKVTYTLAAILLCFLQGCKFYYEAHTVNNVTQQEIKKYDSSNKYLILHRDTSIWQLSEIKVKDESFSGKLSAVPIERSAYQISIPSQGHQYKRINKSEVLDQVHLYLKDSIVTEFDSDGHIKISPKDIKKAEVYQNDGFRTTFSMILPPVLIGGFILLLATLGFPGL